MAKPKLLEIIAEMRSQGMTDEQIVENLRQLGLGDDQINQIMEVANRDVYSRLKGEVVQIVNNQIEKSPAMKKVVREEIKKNLDFIKSEVSKDIDAKMGDLARAVNEKTKKVDALGEAIRKENLGLGKEVDAMRADIDLLLAGPTKFRLILSAFFMLVGVIIVLYSIVAVTPSVIAMNFPDAMSGAILMVTGGMYVIFGIISMMVGLHLYGKPS